MTISVVNISTLLIALFFIVGCTNVIVEVIKSNISKPHPNIICTVTSIIITLIVLIAYCQIKVLAITWYTIIAGIVFGFICAFVSMQNFDKLISLFKKPGIPIDPEQVITPKK